MKLGLIGRSLGHSFSVPYFEKKFRNEGLEHTYENIELEDIQQLESLLETRAFDGFNVTIPYKEVVIPLLDALSLEAQAIGAVNTIFFDGESWIGHNTDWIGVLKSLDKINYHSNQKTLILGSGGASKAVRYAIEQRGGTFDVLSRTGEVNYASIVGSLRDYDLIVNTTPLGTFPNVDEAPKLPYSELHKDQVLFDLVYNPSETAFMKQGLERGCTVLNGRMMLEVQAEASYKCWINRA